MFSLRFLRKKKLDTNSLFLPSSLIYLLPFLSLVSLDNENIIFISLAFCLFIFFMNIEKKECIMCFFITDF